MRKLYFIDPDQKKFEFHFSIIRLPMEKKNSRSRIRWRHELKKESSAKKKIRSRDLKSRLREDADQLPITVCGFILIDCLPLEMAARWLPNTEEFFFSLARLIESSERQLNSASYDNSEFLFRRLDEYERTLATLLARFVESYGSLPSQQNTVSNLCYLRNRVSFLRSYFEQRYVVNWDNCDSRDSRAGNVLCFEREHFQNETPGRPRLAVSREQLEALQECGFRWSDIGRMLCLSSSTLRRRRHELGMPVEGREFSQLSDTQLDDLIRQVLQVTPAAGLRMVQGYLRQRGLTVQRTRILHSLRRVDPVTATLRSARRIIRRVYNVPSPNALW